MERKVKRDDTQYRCQTLDSIQRTRSADDACCRRRNVGNTQRCLSSASSFPPVSPLLKPTRNDCHKDYARCGKLRHLKARGLGTFSCERLLGNPNDLHFASRPNMAALLSSLKCSVLHAPIYNLWLQNARDVSLVDQRKT